MVTSVHLREVKLRSQDFVHALLPQQWQHWTPVCYPGQFSCLDNISCYATLRPAVTLSAASSFVARQRLKARLCCAVLLMLLQVLLLLLPACLLGCR